MLIDTHCHLYKEYYDDLDKLINDMKEKNIYAIVNGTNYEDNKEILDLKYKYSNIFITMGIHPTELEEDNNFDFIKDNKQRIVGIGEIGLDYYWNKDNKEEQIKIFIEQLNFAEQNNLPVIIHSRESTNDLYEILKKFKLKGIIHAFSGSYEMAHKFIKLGYKLGVGGVVTFKNSKLKDVIKQIDINDIVLETDSPYLSPYRGKQNTPLNLEYIAKYIAEIKNISYEEVCDVTSKNAISLFDLDI